MYRTIEPTPDAAAEATVLDPTAEASIFPFVRFSIAVTVGANPRDRYDGVHRGGLPPRHEIYRVKVDSLSGENGIQ